MINVELHHDAWSSHTSVRAKQGCSMLSHMSQYGCKDEQRVYGRAACHTMGKHHLDFERVCPHKHSIRFHSTMAAFGMHIVRLGPKMLLFRLRDVHSLDLKALDLCTCLLVNLRTATQRKG
jgi:hypothetical protein